MNIEYWLNLPLKFWFSAGIMSVVLGLNVIGIFLMYQRLDEMEACLDKCSLIVFSKRFWGNSVRGKIVRLCAVISAVAMPWLNIRRGIVDRQQVQDFPRGLKRVLQGMAIGGLIFLTVGTAQMLCRWLMQ